MRLSLLPILALCACSSIVPSTVARLSTLSPTTADPAGFAVLMTLPDGLGVQRGSARLIFSARRTDTGETLQEDVILERDAGAQLFRIAAADYARLRAAQATARLWETQNKDATQGALSVHVAACKIGAGPDPDARVSVAIQTTQGGEFQPLVRNGPLSAIASAAQIRDMGACLS
ncbi:hypothetical protein SAMN04488005_0158 [Yoonia tamlensis]|uniref:Lipoprotein n=1 Tax=Yoonia tamlensis TaxID=390270 RepID=A0A1I6FPK8_9RHOB|nr:hypothetical protein [Yoonia tamlensis]SFR31727.1 hypothetical protein SAMN04488005_0158 [Yoonia tamlensis]